MNTQTQKENKRNLLKIAILAIVISTLSSSAYAQSSSKPDTAEKEIAVQYLGAEDDMMLIAVRYDNVASSKFILSIYNADGDVLFRNAYTSKDFQKSFKIPKEHGKLNFVFSGVHDKLSRTYTIHNTTKVVEDVVVSKLN